MQMFRYLGSLCFGMRHCMLRYVFRAVERFGSVVGEFGSVVG